ncbi:MAG: 2-keto-4-pentenoate hydratase [Halarchaeum sp.]
MALSQSEIDEMAETLYAAYDEKEPVEPLSNDAEFTTEEAYEIQAKVFDKISDGGTLGHKLGLVSEAKQEQLGIPEPIFAPVVEETVLDGEPVPTEDMIAPRIEAEIGLVLGEDLEPPVRPMDVVTATDAVVPVVEILESRYQGWSIPSAQDVIADLTSAGKVVLGESAKDVSEVDLVMESIAVSVNGEVQASGIGGDIMGNPARAVAWLANRLEAEGKSIDAGELVMTGGIPAAIDIEPGDVYDIEFANIGSIRVRAE